MAQTRICQISGQSFIISAEEEAFCREQSIPLPLISPEERLRAVTSFDNAIYLYNGECAFSHEKVLTSIPPERHVVYTPDIFASDQWDAMNYGREYDFSRPFFSQFGELLQAVPLPSRYVITSTIENSDYVNGVTGAKNCYLVFNCTNGEDIMFSRVINQCKNMLDSFNVQNSELCYGCINVSNSYELFWAENCTNCSNSYFLFNCQNLKNCYGCTNLKDKEYYFENEQCLPEEYQAKVQAKNLGSYQAWLAAYQGFAEKKKSTTRKYYQGQNSEDSSGNYIKNSRRINQGFFVLDSEDVFLGIRVVKGNKIFSSAFAVNNTQQIYTCHAAANNAFNMRWCIACPNQTRDLEYCIHCGFGTKDSFGCVGLRQKEYCILNKQYAKEEYFALRKRIHEHMTSTGEYGMPFPGHLSPQYYNESYAMEFLPLTKAEALRRGYAWKEKDTEEHGAISTLPDHIDETNNDILQQVLLCSQSGKKYRLVKAELDFYRRYHIPIPRIAPLVRIENLSRYLQIKSSVPRQCAKCSISINSVYQTEPILCESCYQQSLL
ncbi:MAG: hypothetical protein HY817_04935 [Candidatus Abawacabacteria bacterium]|nr:hypothetical protein [Candidatus Abawacabacteria bacterium]